MSKAYGNALPIWLQRVRKVSYEEKIYFLLIFFMGFLTKAYYFSRGMGGLSVLINYLCSSLFISFCLSHFVFVIGNRPMRRLLKTLLLLLFLLPFLIESFTLYYYKVLVGPGLVNVVLETNYHEAGEFFQTYIGFPAILCLLLLIGSIGFIFYYCAKKNRQKKCGTIGWIGGLLLCVGLVCVIRQHTVSNDLSLQTPLQRIYYATVEAAQTIQEYKQLYQTLDGNVNLTKNQPKIQTIVLIVGESTGKNHMSLYGYPQDTTPHLRAMAENGELYVFRDVVSPHSHTSAVFSKLFTFANDESKEPWYTYHNLTDIMKAAGYKTYWLSNQESSGAFGNVVQVFADRSDEKKFARYISANELYDPLEAYDEALLPYLDDVLEKREEKKFIVVHLMGTHARYRNRYPEAFEIFREADILPKFAAARKDTIATYDNAVLYNDAIVYQMMMKFKNEESVVIYLSDHGEEVDDFRAMAGHNEDNGSRYMIEIPMTIWLSEQFKSAYPAKAARIEAAVKRPYMTDDMIHSILDLAEIETQDYDPRRSLFNEKFDSSRKRMYHGMDYDQELKGKN